MEAVFKKQLHGDFSLFGTMPIQKHFHWPLP